MDMKSAPTMQKIRRPSKPADFLCVLYLSVARTAFAVVSVVVVVMLLTWLAMGLTSAFIVIIFIFHLVQPPFESYFSSRAAGY